MRDAAAERMKAGARERVRAALDPLVDLLAHSRIHPDWLSAAGLALTAYAAVLFARGLFPAASLVALAGALLDAVDGAVARAQGRESAFGAFLDSTLDRVSDTLLFLGVAGHYFYQPVLASQRFLPEFSARLAGSTPVDDWLRGMAALVALAGAYLVSYTRARSEGLGLACRVGWFERPERLLVLLGAGLFGPGLVMDFALVVLVGMTWLTSAQRFWFVRRQLSKVPLAGDRPR
jgi:CDP-diacylglycerol--glycerol-3-phosphate 3-phosphatidyltransferase